MEGKRKTHHPVQSINRNKLTSELLPQKQTNKCPSLQERGIKNSAAQNLAKNFKKTSDVKRADAILRKRINDGDLQAIFLLGQLYFEEGCFETAFEEFNKIKDTDFQALYQLGVMYYDGLGTKENPALGVEYMNRIINSEDPRAQHLKFVAYYNLGRASFEGFGIQQSNAEAERLWLLAADDGNPKASVKAQTILGLFYSRSESQDLQKAFFWHSEACGNGSLESQGVLGLMYLTGQGIRKDTQSAWNCLKEASSRGNVYAQGHLVAYFYSRKLYYNTVDLAQRVVEYDNIPRIAKETDCLPVYIAKGIAMAAFYYARCLQLGLGIQQNQTEAMKYYCRAINMDRDIATDLHFQVIMARI
ncbi:LRP2-binding protein isoform X1 [Chiloscyllium plagiosum]|uniref:LRP2-binding protein isoform X1 n=1 Tax=Chiloscyllium plagiosum TaxID=36176 RepID=UPI001CB8108F|nr:LRP2-binding protein isoform X1 [Chiloscyllium plagiosum]